MAKEKRNINVRRLLPDILVINVSDEEASKLSAFIRFEIGNLPLFTYIDKIYGIIFENFEEASKFIIIPYVDNTGLQNLTIQKIS